MTKKTNTKLRDLVADTLELEALLRAQQEKLDVTAKQYRQRVEVDIPALMAELGQTEATLADGTAVTVGEHVTASVAARNEAAATKIFKRLRAGELVQVQVVAQFTERDKEALLGLLHYSKQAKLPVAQKNVVNPASLKRWVREMRAAGRLQPADLEVLGVYVQTVATIKVLKS